VCVRERVRDDIRRTSCLYDSSVCVCVCVRAYMMCIYMCVCVCMCVRVCVCVCMLQCVLLCVMQCVVCIAACSVCAVDIAHTSKHGASGTQITWVRLCVNVEVCSDAVCNVLSACSVCCSRCCSMCCRMCCSDLKARRIGDANHMAPVVCVLCVAVYVAVCVAVTSKRGASGTRIIWLLLLPVHDTCQ